MARTYLERNLEEFEDASKDELIRHGLLALKESLGQDKELTVENTSVSVVGTVKDGARKGKVESFKLYDGAEVGPLLEANAEAADDDDDDDDDEDEAPAGSMEVDS